MAKLIVTDFNESRNSFKTIGEMFTLLLQVADIYGNGFVNDFFDDLTNGKVVEFQPTSGYRVNVSIRR